MTGRAGPPGLGRADPPSRVVDVAKMAGPAFGLGPPYDCGAKRFIEKGEQSIKNSEDSVSACTG
jgi:hypothetical protein